MKRILWAAVVLSAVIALGVYIRKPALPREVSAGSEIETEPVPTSIGGSAGLTMHPVESAPVNAGGPASIPVSESQASSSTGRTEAVPFAPADVLFGQAVGVLASSESSYQQRQAAWKHLRDVGKLDPAIEALEQALKSDTTSAVAAAALGEGYYEKAGTTKDVREKAIFAMKADQTLDVALNLDPENWEARFLKAVGLTYWPAELKMGREAMDQFRTLIEMQEKQTPQPHFAQSYLRLGEQYQKAGYPEYAVQIWQRGAALFPDDPQLTKQLTAASQP